MKVAFKIVSVVVAILSHCLLQSSVLASDVPKPTAPLRVPAVSVVKSVKREIAETIVINGTLVPRDEILVTPEIDGYRITEVLAEEGMFVERGQVLARLSRDLIDRQLAQQNAIVDKAVAAVPQAENNIAQADAAAVEARLGFDRAKKLMQTGNTTTVTVEARTSALLQAEHRRPCRLGIGHAGRRFALRASNPSDEVGRGLDCRGAGGKTYNLVHHRRLYSHHG